jgi:hypothetical protein
MVRPARLLFIFLLIATLPGCCCPSSSTGAAKARALTQEQLATLYARMESHTTRLGDFEGRGIDWGSGKSAAPLPEEFARAGAVSGNVGRFNWLIFGGCMDDKAILSFHGLREDGPKQIELMPGERQAPEVLWRAAEESSATP